MKKLFWKVRYCFYFWQRVRWTWKEIWKYSVVSYENLEGDGTVDEHPKEAVSDDISCFSD